MPHAISAKKYSKPRQGINTCGANDIFFFDQLTELDENLAEVCNKKNKAILPKKFLLPVITVGNFNEKTPSPKKWVLLPYNPEGRPLTEVQIKKEPALFDYLESQKEFLKNRKGVLIRSWINKGFWWALLGVGDYNFYPFKVVWQAYGKSSFSPKIFPKQWQANQSLQAFMPTITQIEAKDLLDQLNNSQIERYLLSLKMEGTMNWAQPGRIKKLINFNDDIPQLFESKLL